MFLQTLSVIKILCDFLLVYIGLPWLLLLIFLQKSVNSCFLKCKLGLSLPNELNKNGVTNFICRSNISKGISHNMRVFIQRYIFQNKKNDLKRLVISKVIVCVKSKIDVNIWRPFLKTILITILCHLHSTALNFVYY